MLELSIVELETRLEMSAVAEDASIGTIPGPGPISVPVIN